MLKKVMYRKFLAGISDIPKTLGFLGKSKAAHLISIGATQYCKKCHMETYPTNKCQCKSKKKIKWIKKPSKIPRREHKKKYLVMDFSEPKIFMTDVYPDDTVDGWMELTPKVMRNSIPFVESFLNEISRCQKRKNSLKIEDGIFFKNDFKRLSKDIVIYIKSGKLIDLRRMRLKPSLDDVRKK